MGPLDFSLHLLGFLAPAFTLALTLPLAARWLLRPSARPFWQQGAAVFAAGALVLLAGLWWFGRDGKMATYAALVLATGTAQWFASAGWRAGRA